MLQQHPDPRRVARQDVTDRFQEGVVIPSKRSLRREESGRAA